MVTLVDLALPILLAAVLVFVVSSVFHMVLQFHKSDYGRLQREAELLDTLRSHGVQPGHYMFPCAGSMKEMSSPEMVAKFQQGPIGFLTVMPTGMPNIGKNLLQWFVFSLAVGALAGYVATVTLPRGAEFGVVLRVTAVAAMLGYAVAHVQNAIWKGERWSTTAKFVFDGVVYGLVTGMVFGWLWPSA